MWLGSRTNVVVERVQQVVQLPMAEGTHDRTEGWMAGEPWWQVSKTKTYLIFWPEFSHRYVKQYLELCSEPWSNDWCFRYKTHRKLV